jgi:hypothetical protein
MIREGAENFVTALAGKAEISLQTFGERPTVAVEYTTDQKKLLDGVHRIFARPGAGAYLMEAIVEASKGLEKKKAARPVIAVLMIDRGVEFSNNYYKTVLDAIGKSGASLNVISLGPVHQNMSDEIRNRDQVVAIGTDETGGRRDNVLAFNRPEHETARVRTGRSIRRDVRAPRAPDSAQRDRRGGQQARPDRARADEDGRSGGAMSAQARTSVAVLALAVAGAAALAAQQRIHSGVELVSLNVTVTDGTGKDVPGLGQDDFQVYEDGAQQKLTFFTPTQQPISLAILLDTSASMEERMDLAREAAIGFTRQLHHDDQAEVIDFDSQVRVLSPFTSDGASLERPSDDDGSGIDVAV